MSSKLRRFRQPAIYFTGAMLATICNLALQKSLLSQACMPTESLCRIAVITMAIAISFGFKYCWDNWIVFKGSTTSALKKSSVFLLSSLCITSIYLVILSILAIAGFSNDVLITAGWLLFSLGYLTKYVIDKRFAFASNQPN
jgi:hypothetical protein